VAKPTPRKFILSFTDNLAEAAELDHCGLPAAHRGTYKQGGGAQAGKGVGWSFTLVRGVAGSV
jgi:hypothetical protein